MEDNISMHLWDIYQSDLKPIFIFNQIEINIKFAIQPIPVIFQILIPSWKSSNPIQYIYIYIYDNTVWILAGKGVNFSIAAGLIRLHMPDVK